jgi:putative membrane protein
MRGKVFARCALIAALATPAAVYAQSTSGTSGATSGSGSGSGSSYHSGSTSGARSGSASGSGSSYGSGSASDTGTIGAGSSARSRTKAKAANNPKAGQPLSDSDFKVLAHFHDVNLAEIEFGKLGEERATSPAVKKYAQMLARDHTKNDKELTTLATSRDMVLPTTPSDPDEVSMQQQMTESMDSLRALTGPDFDHQFLTSMVDDHQKQIDRIDADAKNVTDPKLAAAVKQTRPMLIKHRDEAKKLLQITAKANRTTGAGSANEYGAGSASGATAKHRKHTGTSSGSGSGSGSGMGSGSASGSGSGSSH